MPVYDIYSKRKKRLAGLVPDVYTYDSIPPGLRNQIVFIAEDIVFSLFGDSLSESLYEYLSRTLSREWGTEYLVENGEFMERGEEVKSAIRKLADADYVLDIVELLLQTTQEHAEDERNQVTTRAKSALSHYIEELNHRFKEHGVGYEYSDGQIIRIDSQLLHSEVVKPALRLLSEPGFEGAHDEYLAAHEHFRHRRYKEALNEALKAFESTIKVIA